MQLADIHVHISHLRSGLQARQLLAPLPGASHPWQLVFLDAGTMSAQPEGAGRDDLPFSLDAPAVLCWPAGARQAVTLHAGSTGVHLAVADSFLRTALGNRPEAPELRDMVRAVTALPLADLPGPGQRMAQALGEIALEQSEAALGDGWVVEAQLRCVLVQIWRHSHAAKGTATALGPQAQVLQRFRRLVEVHYRARWKVSDYADALNTTPDRLHNIATQVLGRTPIALIHDRSHHEARALLMRTNMSLDQIAVYLNFNSTPQFSAFFRKREGVPPGRFRAARTAPRSDAPQRAEVEFSDWP